MAKLRDNFNKIVIDLSGLLHSSYQIGFVRGHDYLNEPQVALIRTVLNSRDGEAVVREYENQLAALIGPGRGVSFAAGRMAFYAVLKALGVGSGDEVILPGFTCSVMPNAVWRTGARPVFADIEAETFGSCASGIAAKITSRTKAVVAQHSFGIPCNIPEIVELCRKRGLALIEDCAITLDSAYDGKKVGNWGDAAIFSTDHSKPLNTLVGGFLLHPGRGALCKGADHLRGCTTVKPGPPIPAFSTISSRTALLSAGELPPPPGAPVSGSLNKEDMGRREAAGFYGKRL